MSNNKRKYKEYLEPESESSIPVTTQWRLSLRDDQIEQGSQDDHAMRDSTSTVVCDDEPGEHGSGEADSDERGSGEAESDEAESDEQGLVTDAGDADEGSEEHHMASDSTSTVVCDDEPGEHESGEADSDERGSGEAESDEQGVVTDPDDADEGSEDHYMASDAEDIFGGSSDEEAEGEDHGFAGLLNDMNVPLFQGSQTSRAEALLMLVLISLILTTLELSMFYPDPFYGDDDYDDDPLISDDELSLSSNDVTLDSEEDSFKSHFEPCIGYRVIRGPDWVYGAQDGGRGHAGTIIKGTGGRGNPPSPKGTVQVQWDNGRKGLYRAGYNEAFDLRTFDTSAQGYNNHTQVWCNGCNWQEINGFRWRCTNCFGFDLCTDCYMNNKHNLDHVFMRVECSVQDSMGPKMLPRRFAQHIDMQGIFPGAKVMKYPNSAPKDKNPKATQSLTVIPDKRKPTTTLKEEEDEEEQGDVSTETATGEKEHHRLGRKGQVQLICTRPALGGQVYEGHLPLTGNDRNSDFDVGERVIVAVPQQKLEELQRRRGLWKPAMTNLFQQEGTLTERLDTGDFVVTFKDTPEAYPMNTAALLKLDSFCLGQTVRVSEESDRVQRLQRGHGGWTAAMKSVLGKTGQVVEKDGQDFHVRFASKKKFVFHAACLTSAFAEAADKDDFDELDEEEVDEIFIHVDIALHNFHRTIRDPNMNVVLAAAQNDVAAVKRILDQKPEWANFEPKKGVSLLFYAARQCSTDILRVLVERGAFIDIASVRGITPLMHATYHNKAENVKYLLEQGAEVDRISSGGYFTSLYIACCRGHVESARHLLEHGADVNHKCDEEMTPWLAASKDSSCGLLSILSQRTDTDFKAVSNEDSGAFLNALHFTASMDNVLAVAMILRKVPRLANQDDGEGMTPLHYAAKNDAARTAEVLIKQGRCKLNVQDIHLHQTPLLTALMEPALATLDVLVRNGADVNLANKVKITCLGFVLDLRRDPFMKLSDAPILTEAKKKWRHLGVRTNYDALAAYFVWHGADLNTKNRQGVGHLSALRQAKDPFAHTLQTIHRQSRQDLAKQPAPHLELRSVTSTINNNNDYKPDLGKSSHPNGPSEADQAGPPDPEQKPSKPKKNRGRRRYRGKKGKENGVADAPDAEGHGGRSQEGNVAATSSHQEEPATELAGPEMANGQARDTKAVKKPMTELIQRAKEPPSPTSPNPALERLVKTKISFACGHDVVRNAEDPKTACPFCSEQAIRGTSKFIDQDDLD